jgi:hypothetical protein
MPAPALLLHRFHLLPLHHRPLLLHHELMLLHGVVIARGFMLHAVPQLFVLRRNAPPLIPLHLAHLRLEHHLLLCVCNVPLQRLSRLYVRAWRSSGAHRSSGGSVGVTRLQRRRGFVAHRLPPHQHVLLVLEQLLRPREAQ